MMNLHFTEARSVFIGTIIAGFAFSACAQNYPTKPIRLIVPYAPGGKSDMIGRLVGQKLEERLGQPVIVDNRAGAGGNIGTNIVAKARPDGYTLLVGAPGPISINVSLFKDLPYDPVKELAPITKVVSTANVLVVNAGMGVNSVSDLIKRAKATSLNYASGGVGSAGHLATELFALMAGVKMAHIPYRGATPALLDVIGGRVSLIITNMPAAWPHVRGGKLTALAVTTSTRSPAAPELPTVAEAGLRGYEADNWSGILAPAGTPTALIQRLRDEIVKGLNTPEIKQMLARDGGELIGSTPAEFRQLIAREIIDWGKVVKASGATPD